LIIKTKNLKKRYYVVYVSWGGVNAKKKTLFLYELLLIIYFFLFLCLLRWSIPFLFLSYHTDNNPMRFVNTTSYCSFRSVLFLLQYVLYLFVHLISRPKKHHIFFEKQRIKQNNIYFWSCYFFHFILMFDSICLILLNAETAQSSLMRLLI
jgi:hypothetical protein